MTDENKSAERRLEELEGIIERMCLPAIQQYLRETKLRREDMEAALRYARTDAERALVHREDVRGAILHREYIDPEYVVPQA